MKVGKIWDIPDEETWDYYEHHNGVGSITIFETDDDPELMDTGLVDKNGNKIVKHYPSQKLGHIGFVSPEHFEAIHMAIEEMEAEIARQVAEAETRMKVAEWHRENKPRKKRTTTKKKRNA